MSKAHRGQIGDTRISDLLVAEGPFGVGIGERRTVGLRCTRALRRASFGDTRFGTWGLESGEGEKIGPGLPPTASPSFDGKERGVGALRDGVSFEARTVPPPLAARRLPSALFAGDDEFVGRTLGRLPRGAAKLVVAPDVARARVLFAEEAL